MGLERLNDNDFIDIDKVSHFYLENNALIVILDGEKIQVPDAIRGQILTALFRNDYSKRKSNQYVSV